MRLWTIQSKNVYEIIQSEGVYRCNPDLSPLIHYDIDSVDTMFSDAYAWMVQQMKVRIGNPPEGATYPIWAWHTWEAQHKRPDMRKYDFLQSEDSVLLEIEIPESQVLLSDEVAWQSVVALIIFSEYRNLVDFSTIFLMDEKKKPLSSLFGKMSEMDQNVYIINLLIYMIPAILVGVVCAYYIWDYSEKGQQKR